MIVKTRREEEETNETVKAGRILRTGKCKYLGMTISTDGQLTEHIKELNSRCDIINREISAIGAKTQVGKEEVRVKLKLFETCLMPFLLYGMEAWQKLSKAVSFLGYLALNIAYTLFKTKKHFSQVPMLKIVYKFW